LLRLLVSDLTEAECAADMRTAQLEQAVCRFYSVLNVAVCLLESEPWDEAWIRLPFLAEVANLFAASSDLYALSVGAELRRRYGSLFGNAHRLMDVAIAQCMEAAGPEVTVGIFGGWRWRAAAGGSIGPFGGLVQRSSEGDVVLSGPGVVRGMDVPVSAGGCLNLLRNACGRQDGSWSIGSGKPRGATDTGTGGVESPQVSALDALIGEGVIRTRDVDGVGLDLLGRSTDWFDAQRRAEAGELEDALPALSDAWRLYPEFTMPTVALGAALIPQARPEVLVRLADLLLDDGCSSPVQALGAARLLVAARDPAAAERVLETLGLSLDDPACSKIRAEVHLHRRETAAAFGIFGEWVRSRPHEVDGWVGLARCYVAEHRLDDALAALVHARIRCPEHGGLRELEDGLREASAGKGDVPGMGLELESVVGREVLARGEAPGFVRPDARQRYRFRFLPGGWQVPEEMEALAWLAGDPVRIAGFASWQISSEVCRVQWMVRSRWQPGGMGAARFLRAILDAIRASAPSLPILMTMGAERTLDGALLEAGFESLGTDQLWVLDNIPACLVEVERRQASISPEDAVEKGWTVRDARQDDIDWLMALFCRARLMSEIHARSALANPVGRIVLVVEREGLRQGAALLRQHGTEMVIEVENADLRGFRDRLGFKFALYKAICRRAIQCGAARLCLTTNADTNRRIPNFVISLQGRMEGESRVFRMGGA
jgi:hypothetical protein